MFGEEGPPEFEEGISGKVSRRVWKEFFNIVELGASEEGYEFVFK